MLFNGGYSDDLEDVYVDKTNTPKVIFYPPLYHTSNILEQKKSIVLSVVNKITCIIPKK